WPVKGSACWREASAAARKRKGRNETKRGVCQSGGEAGKQGRGTSALSCNSQGAEARRARRGIAKRAGAAGALRRTTPFPHGPECGGSPRGPYERARRATRGG